MSIGYHNTMSETLDRIRELVHRGEIRVSNHGYDQLSEDGILVKEVLCGVAEARLLEDYPGYLKGPCVLVLQHDLEERPIHVVWGIPRGTVSPAVLVTGYRPDPRKWTNGFIRRRP